MFLLFPNISFILTNIFCLDLLYPYLYPLLTLSSGSTLLYKSINGIGL